MNDKLTNTIKEYKSCFHTSEQEAIKIGIIKDTEMNNHNTKKKQLMDLIEELKGKGVSANVSAQVAVSFMNGKESKWEEK